MSSLTTYPSHSGEAAYVDGDRLRAVLQRQQHEQVTAAPTPCPNYLIDVPVSDTDVQRWAQVFTDAVSTVADGDGAAGANEETSSGPAEEGTPFFLNAETLLKCYSSDAERRAAVYERLAPFARFNANAVATMPMTKALKFRREWLPYRQRIPLHGQRMQLLDAVLNHDMVALVADTGSGKTLQTPIILSETEALKRRRIVLVSATATAARLTAVRLREERGEDAESRTVAVTLPLRNECVEGTVIVVTTAEVLLRQLLADPLLLDVACVIFDDVHVRTVETELCLTLLRERIAVHAQHERASTAATAAPSGGPVDAGPASAVRKLHVVLNCLDETVAAPLVEFLSAPVPLRSAVASSSSSSTGPAAAVAVAPGCRVTTFVLDSKLNATGSNAEARVPRNSFVYYLEETVQWLQKCTSEGRSELCAEPETELQPFLESVDAVTRIMAAADAEFAIDAKCREYWCRVMHEAISHYTSAAAQVPHQASESPQQNILIVAPSSTSARLICQSLRQTLSQDEATAARAFTFTILDETRTPFDTFLSLARQGGPSAHRAGHWHVLLTSPELAQTVMPASLAVDLLIDCARTAHRTFDVSTASDLPTTEYSTVQTLRYRRSIAAAAPVTSAPVMRIQLIPKSVLHSVPHRRFSADAAQHHPAFRLSFERYQRLYMVLQAREEAAAYGRQRAADIAIGASLQTTNNAPWAATLSTVSSRIAALLTTHLVAPPSAASGNRLEHMRRVFTAVENYLVAAGHVDVSLTDSNEAFAEMKPLGALLTFLPSPLPAPVARLLVLSALFACPVEATAIAAAWLVGDAFDSRNHRFGDDNGQANGASGAALDGGETEEELRELSKEARSFFSRDSVSDVVSAFNVYKMWLSLRTHDGSTAVDEQEEAFLAECHVPRRLLLLIKSTQEALYELLRRTGLASASGGANAATPSSALADRVAALSDEATMDGKVQACLTGALYPNCAVVEDARDAKSSAMVLLDGLHVMSPGRSSPTGTAVTAKRFGVFAENSIVNDGDSTAKVVGRPFLFLDKTTASSVSGSQTAFVAVLEQATPLQQEASVVFCGEGHERPKVAPTRCRGWTPCLTGAWRQTRRARLLPPPAQLPTPSIALEGYDTIKAPSVILSTDDNFQFTMRSTTSRWLLQLRAHINGQLRRFIVTDRTALLSGDGTRASNVSFAEVAEAWDWWGRRLRGGPAWLREVRHVQAKADSSSKEDAAADGGEKGAGAATERKNLFEYFTFRTEPGKPVPAALPSTKDANSRALADAKKRKKGGAAAATPESDAGPAPAAALATSAAADGSTPAAAAKVYTGKRPSADVDATILMCVKGVAKRRTREHEVQLLQDDPVMFAFLNPDNVFHEYYLYRLKEAAPTLEVLGDSLEELVEFLEGLEKELRKETGYDEEKQRAAQEQLRLQQQQQQQQLQQQQQYERQQQSVGGGVLGTSVQAQPYAQATQQLREVDLPADQDGADEYDAYTDGMHAGLQIERDAAVPVRRNIGLRRVPTEEPARTEPAAAPVAAAPVPTPAAAPASAAPSGQQTLLEKLMAMKQAAGGGAAVAPTPAPVVAPPSAPVAPQQEPASIQPTRAPGPMSNAELLALLQAPRSAPAGGPPDAAPAVPSPQADVSAPPVETASSAAPQQAAPTTAELLALLGMPMPTPQMEQQPQQQQPLPPQLQPYGAPVFGAAGVGGGMAPYGIPGMPPTMYADIGMESIFGERQDGLPGAVGYDQEAVVQPVEQQAPVNPLTRPPPPLPAKVVDESPASVVVYPLPDRSAGNIPLLLARALGELLDVRVGPTTVVGRVARIDVPNAKVAARAMELRRFRCGGVKVFIFRNDRIVDNPDGVSSTGSARMRRRRGAGALAGAAAPGGRRQRYGNRADGGMEFDGNAAPKRSRRDAFANDTYRPQGEEDRARGFRSDYADPSYNRWPPHAAADGQNDAALEDVEDTDDPTSTAFQAQVQQLPAGISVGAFSDSDSDDAGEEK